MTDNEIAFFANLIQRAATCANCGAPFHPLQPCPQTLPSENCSREKA